MQCVRNCTSPNPKERHYFEQPVMQTFQMFIGEAGCWLVVWAFSAYRYIQSRRAGYEAISSSDDSHDDNAILQRDEHDSDDVTAVESGSSTPPIANPLKPSHPNDPPPGSGEEEIHRIPLTGMRVFLLLLPAVCDIAATTLMNVGLLFVAASIYQMTRGALVLFVGLFSVLFLRRHLSAYKWMALFIVVAGVAVVGLAGAISKDEKATPSSTEVVHRALRIARDQVEKAATPEAVKTIVGVLLIAGAQIGTASQFVLEESIMHNYELEPIKVVGWEGLFGVVITFIGMVILHFAVGRTDAGRYGYFDMAEGLRQITHYRAIAVSSVLIMISIGYVPCSASYRSTHQSFIVTNITTPRDPSTLSKRKTGTSNRQNEYANFGKQWFQFLRPLGDPLRLRNIPLHNRHMPYPLHLDRFAWSRLGDIQMASSTRFCHVGIWNLPLQRAYKTAISTVVWTYRKKQGDSLTGGTH
jgi:drug/metabolite transporter (DMT)-like permease